MTPPVEIRPDELSRETLRRLIEEFVTREGTDYGHVDPTLEAKVVEVRRQLTEGEAVIVFDPKTETFNIVRRSSI